MRLLPCLLASLMLTACTPYSETIGGAAPVGTIWELESVNGAASPAEMTLSFRADGTVSGLLPCNRYTARQRAPLPWFELRDLATTRRLCPEIADETRLKELLQSMDLAEIAGDGMLLSNRAEQSLFFRAR